jgi:purine-binding chemotaxis protein CheW
MGPSIATVDQSQFLTFYLAGEEYGIGILRVKEILEYDTVTPVPQTPPAIRGVINLRGSVVPVVDLAAKFGLPPSPLAKRTCIVIVEVNLAGRETVMGLLVDAVSQVMDLTAGDIEPPPAFGTAVKVDYLQAMGKVGKKFVLLLDVDKVLAAPELLQAETLGATPAEGAGASEEEQLSPPAEAKQS